MRSYSMGLIVELTGIYQAEKYEKQMAEEAES
jgi:hypothetical protein